MFLSRIEDILKSLNRISSVKITAKNNLLLKIKFTISSEKILNIKNQRFIVIHTAH